MMILDSSIWVAWFDVDDSQHREAQELARSIHEPIVVPEYVVAEVCTVLTRKAGKQTALLFIQTVLENKQVDILFSSPALFSTTLKEFLADSHGALSFTDRALAVLSRMYRVATFDKALQKEITKQDEQQKRP